MTWRWPGAARRAAERQAFLDALQAVVAIASAHASATEALAMAVAEWARPFKTPTDQSPDRWVNNDEAEWLREQEEVGALAPGASHAEQLAALAKAMDSGWTY
jgi:hypothetical protein